MKIALFTLILFLGLTACTVTGQAYETILEEDFNEDISTLNFEPSDNIGDLREKELLLTKSIGMEFSSAGGCGGANGGLVTCSYNLDIPYLQEGLINIDDGYNNYAATYREQVIVRESNEVTNFAVHTGLTIANPDEDFGTDTFVPVGASNLNYEVIFDIPNGTNLSNINEENPLYLPFLGDELVIVGVPAYNKISVRTGQEFLLNVGESVIVDGKHITLNNVGSTGNVQVTVGDSKVVDAIGTQFSLEGDMWVQVLNYFYTDDYESRSAVLIVSSTGATRKTFTSGDAYIGQDETDPDWIWTIDIDNTQASIGVTWDHNSDDPTDEMIGRGLNALCLPQDYVCIGLGGGNDVQYRQLTLDTITANNVVSEQGIPIDLGASTVLVWDVTTLVNDSIYNVSLDAGELGQYPTDGVATWYNGDDSNSTNGSYQFFYQAGNEWVRFETLYAGFKNIFILNVGETRLTVLAEVTNDGLRWKLGESSADLDGDDIFIETKVVNGEFDYIGLDPDTAVAASMRYGWEYIGNWEENTMTDYGIVVVNPADTMPNNVQFLIPDQAITRTVYVGRAACEDPDGGLNYKQYSAPRITYPDGSVELSQGDTCVDSQKLREYFCVPPGTTSVQGGIGSGVEECTYGCANGKCNDKPAPTKPVRQQIVPK